MLYHAMIINTVHKVRSVSTQYLAMLALMIVFPTAQAAEMEDTITVSSTAFEHHGTVPLAYSAYGDNTVPSITWSDLPEGTQQLALVMDDPIAPTPQPFVHWVAYNIPADAEGLWIANLTCQRA